MTLLHKLIFENSFCIDGKDKTVNDILEILCAADYDEEVELALTYLYKVHVD